MMIFWTDQRLRSFLIAGATAALLAGCAKSTDEAAAVKNCAPSELPPNVSTSTASSRVFLLDPMVGAGRSDIYPQSRKLDEYATPVTLERLGGHGVLEGQYVEVRNGTSCEGWFGAYDPKNAFSYPHSDERFQEAMSYHWGDSYRHQLDSIGYLQPAEPVTIWAHCRKEDNAFFIRGMNSAGQKVELVCLGDSVATAGAYYSDDATVVVHELQHATTTDTYSYTERLNQFWYDEAGALNEAISDFMALVFEEPLLGPVFDAKLFSRWALGTFTPQYVSTRGAHRCPTYDPSYPNCGNYPAFSGTNNTVSYVYPDGLGWPYANNFQGPGYVSSAFSTYKGQEQIHNAGVLLEGALWDVYEAIRSNHGGDHTEARTLAMKIVLEAIKHLPQSTGSSVSPVTFRGLAEQMQTYAAAVGLSSADQASLTSALTARGLLGGTPLTSSWGAVGPGASGTLGLRIEDTPAQLKSWLIRMTEDVNAGALVPQGVDTGINGKLNSGELVALWFDLKNVAAQTAGGVEVTVTSLDPEVTFDPRLNGAVNTSGTMAQIRYGKVNGTSIVSALTSSNATYHVPTGNSYFRTNPFFDRNWTTALWARVSSGAAHGKTVRFQVEATPSNGAATVVQFSTVIQ